ncbi:seipin [Poecile atricapillus]|uniref:seipin n=1 Tax=Poecile atricapillus TaxID=48891 RepID=UPI002738FFA9|nr:seipin [Poecile atricapillus]
MSPGSLPPGWGSRLGLGARRVLLRGALGLSLALLLLWASIFLYGSFYWAYLPTAAVLRPVHLEFRSDCERPGPELCSFPSANVSLLGEHREKVLLYGQLYRISLELELPESPVNRELGMFMVRLRLYGNGGKTLATASRSAMLHYRSRLLRALHTAAFALLFLSGFAEQSQTLELELLGRYREDPYTPTVGALVEIQSRRVQLYGARLRVHAHFSGLRYLLYHFPLTCAVLGVAGNWALLALLSLGGVPAVGEGHPTPPTPPTRTGAAQPGRSPRGGGGERSFSLPPKFGGAGNGGAQPRPPPAQRRQRPPQGGGGAGGGGRGGGGGGAGGGRGGHPHAPPPPPGPPLPPPAAPPLLQLLSPSPTPRGGLNKGFGPSPTPPKNEFGILGRYF